MAGPERCNYPGALSHGTRGELPYFCRHHFFCADAPEGGRIVAQSRKWRQGDDVPPRMRLIESPQPAERVVEAPVTAP